jgi:hypothetical protein
MQLRGARWCLVSALHMHPRSAHHVERAMPGSDTLPEQMCAVPEVT